MRPSQVQCAIGWRLLSVAVLASASAVMSGCLFGDDTVSGTGGSNGDPPQCRADGDCAFMDTDQDACTAAACQNGRCTQRLIKNTQECQCHGNDDCGGLVKDCSSGICEAHKCVQKIAPAGPAPKQEAGDCQTLLCDGTNLLGAKEFDPADLPTNDNPCATVVCDAATKSVKRTTLANGTACGEGVCFDAKCLTCKPQNPTSCGGEGADEPRNDSQATPSAFSENAPFCAHTSSTDVDWYTFNADDGTLTNDILRFHFWSTAPQLQLCVYVRCVNAGTPLGGCDTKLPGPNGSQGCCWTGPANTLAPSWDLDCQGTTEDSGTVYMSVSAPSSTACETYAMSGGY